MSRFAMVCVESSEAICNVLSATTGTLEEAQQYCRRIARSHYENFLVATCFVPRGLRQHFFNVYAYCRLADDLADEIGDSETSLVSLDRWQLLLEQCYKGSARHPVFMALAETVRQFAIPIEPFANLLTAFRQDQMQFRYETGEELLQYCRNSADPVGRIMLHLGHCHNDESVEYSDSICTGLQLTNFCQDVGRDFIMGRVYLPRESFDFAGYDEKMLAAKVENGAFRRLMEIEVQRAEACLQAGWPLVRQTPRWLSLDVAMFISGGLEVLRQIRQSDYRVLSSRPKVSKRRQCMLLASCWIRQKCGLLGKARS